MSDNPRGPWTYTGVIIDRNLYPDGKTGDYNSDTCHPAIVDFKGKSYVFYHNSALPTGGQTRRSVCVEELFYNPDGTIRKVQKTSTGLVGKASRIQSALRKEQFVTISGFNVVMGSENTGSEAYKWEFVKGLVDGGEADMVSIQSVSFPGYYLTVNGNKVVLSKNDGSEGFKKGATFKKVPGLADKNGVSFQLSDDKQRYIRQGASENYLEVVSIPTGSGSSEDKQGATFNAISVR